MASETHESPEAIPGAGQSPLPDRIPPRREGQAPRNLEIPITPKAWRRALEIVQLEFPMAVIYGGCLRDMVCDVFPNDVDIAVPYFSGRAEQFHDRIERIGRQFGKPTDDVYEGEQRLKDYLENMAGAVGAVVNLGEWSPPSSLVADHGGGWRNQNGLRQKLQIVALTGDPEEFSMDMVLGRCDFGICRIGFDGKLLHMTSEFMHDWQNRLFTIRNPYNVEATYKRWERIGGRYGNYTYINPFATEDKVGVERIAREKVIDDPFNPEPREDLSA